ncbi:hypothetical protein [Thermus thermophilus]|uniref:Lipoprotein n=2 Tax=Thermus thermophilus TaxID=274 RepID=A0AAD1KRZ5_THETH|nr:hypothetical protein [Thermus thermophilus]BBL81299.1 hypothetical protein TthAA220_00830 [Thermus thermophilus]BBL83602.1 hypothetical protein TthAA229_00830 [Thermus thermophilus]BCZ85901.1 hypothetical protein TthAA11_00830 [Thermus thermophilus]BCZ88280.1 hypothetical protein TthAA22_00850 [Thermus thermophilus]BCZ93468.1 hypothetical protein TthAK1_00850 [Thermus thermophilus]
MRYGYSVLLAVGLLAACSGSPQGLQPQVAAGPEVAVEKTANPGFTRVYTWIIAKRVTDPADALLLAPGQAYRVEYAVDLVGTPTDRDFQVEGTVTIKNTGVGAVVLKAPTDTLSTGEAVHLSCGVDFPYTLAEGASLVCTYSQTLPDGKPRTNTVTVPWGTDGTSFPHTASAEKAFAFQEPSQVVDGSVTVSDPSATPTQATSGVSPEGVITQTHLFERWVRFDACGEYEVENTATFTTHTTGAQGSASATVKVSVPCEGACTLTQGYWKTHSRYGPAPYDATWAGIGEDTPFYLSGQSHHEVLWTPPAGGNAYYILAHQFIAAQLNVLNGASTTPAVDAALAWAEGFFQTHTPTSFGKTLARQAKDHAATLDAYNNGLAGPVHCSE